MRIDEDKIFGAYMNSLLEESKMGKKNLPPWLKDKKEEKGEKDEKGEKKSDKKKKNLPPWLKGKGKKVVKEEVEDSSIGMSREDKIAAFFAAIETADEETVNAFYEMLDPAENVSADGSSEEVPTDVTSPVASIKNPPQDTSRYVR